MTMKDDPAPERRSSVVTDLVRNRIGDVVPLRLSYRHYIASAQWRVQRIRYFAVHDKCCCACGSQEQIELHHRSYERFMNESDEDLRSLCAQCHQWVHHLERTSGKSLAEATDAVQHADRRQRPAPAKMGPAEPTFGRGESSVDKAAARTRQRQGSQPEGRSSASRRGDAAVLRAREAFRREWERNHPDGHTELGNR
jgi:hypothetical protein